MNLKWAGLAAAVCVAIATVYPNLAQFVWNVQWMAAGRGHPGLPLLSQAEAMWMFLPSLGLTAFLTTLFLEQCGRAVSQTRRKVARIGALLMGVQTALQGAVMVQRVFLLRLRPASVATSWALVRVMLAGVVLSALWTALLSAFATQEDPFQDAATRPLALILAADTAVVAGLWSTYSYVPILKRQWYWGFDAAWRMLLSLAINDLVRISLVVFLLSVWRFRARAAVTQDVS
jgi:hypothetical protein